MSKSKNGKWKSWVLGQTERTVKSLKEINKKLKEIKPRRPHPQRKRTASPQPSPSPLDKSEASKKVWENPEMRERIIAGIKAALARKKAEAAKAAKPTKSAKPAKAAAVQAQA
jgi:hypothetical protein